MAESTYNGFTNRETWLVNVFYREQILEDGINLLEGNRNSNPSIGRVEFKSFILSNNILSALKNRSACLMSNHGQITYGKNLDNAFELAQEVENICHQYINAIRIGIPKLLSKREMKIVLDKMKNYKKD